MSVLLGIGEPLYPHPWQENFRHGFPVESIGAVSNGR